MNFCSPDKKTKVTLMYNVIFWKEVKYNGKRAESKIFYRRKKSTDKS